MRLRPPQSRDVEWFDRWMRTPGVAGEFGDFGLPARSLRDAVDRVDPSPDLGGTLVVEHEGALGGTVSWHAVTYGPNPESRAFDLGILLVPSMRGRGVGSQAQRLAVEYLFRTTSVHRVQASTDVENMAERRALEKAGFRAEGVARGAQFRAGTYHDMALYGVLRSDL